MTNERLRELLAAYGADPARWPEAERAAVKGIPSDGDAVAAARMDSLLALHPTPARPTLDAATIVARVTATAQPRGFSTQSPATGRASWAATFGWRRLAGFASVAVFGFLIGFTDLDSSFLSSDDAEPATGIFGVFEDAPW
jgi:hypothetical protein